MPGKPNALDLQNQLCFAVYSTAHAFNRAYKPLLEALSLTYPQYLVMLVLWEEDGQTMKEIGERLFLDSGTLTPLLKRLEAAGLITRTREPSDERLVRIALTSAGKALRKAAERIPVELACAIGRSSEDIERLKADLLSVRESLHKADRDAA
jgi:MarR family transcriptional regulator, organic hydroperoxide resistance regulator